MKNHINHPKVRPDQVRIKPALRCVAIPSSVPARGDRGGAPNRRCPPGQRQVAWLGRWWRSPISQTAAGAGPRGAARAGAVQAVSGGFPQMLLKGRLSYPRCCAREWTGRVASASSGRPAGTPQKGGPAMAPARRRTGRGRLRPAVQMYGRRGAAA